MTYAGIDRKRFAQILEWGADDDELRRFFADSRIQLIQKGAKVQNLPHGKPTRVRVLSQGLPQGTDRLVQKWFFENLTMVDPEPVKDLVEALRMYEDAGESPPQDEAKRLARSCLVHLFSNDPPPELMALLKPPPTGNAPDTPEPKEAVGQHQGLQSMEAMPPALGKALVALAEGLDPDEHLSLLPAPVASFVAGVHAVRSGRNDETRLALEALTHTQEARTLLAEYSERSAAARTRESGAPRGLQMVAFAPPDEAFKFNFDRDEIIGVCTRDFPESAVFVSPFAIRSAGGAWIALADKKYREELFFSSGDLIAFPGGRDIPRQPKRGEIGIWRVAENKVSNTGHRTNFHISSEKVPIYEVRDLPFSSTDYDSVREFIKHQVEAGGAALAKYSLFILRDQLILGCPAGRDLARDEGFDLGVPCWRSLPAFRFEGRVLVPGPLPQSEVYECEALGSSLRKLFASGAWAGDKPAKAQIKKLQELIASGEPRLSAARVARLRSELAAIDDHEGAMAVLLEEVMRDSQVSLRVDELVRARVDALVAQKDQLHKSVQQLELRQAELVEHRRQTEKDHKAIPPTVNKAIRAAFDKARNDSLGTLGQVAVFKALMDELVERPPSPPITVAAAVGQPEPAASSMMMRFSDGAAMPVAETLRALGVTPKSARAIEAVGNVAHVCGLILVVDGLAARVAAESWLTQVARPCRVLECGFGHTSDLAVRSVLAEGPDAIAILDANLSPIDLYARPLLDAVLRRLAGIDNGRFTARVLLAVSEELSALPLPRVVESVSLRVSLDRVPAFLREEDVAARLEELASEEPTAWFSKIWKPAGARLLSCVRSLASEEAAFVLSSLEAAAGPQGRAQL